MSFTHESRPPAALDEVHRICREWSAALAQHIGTAERIAFCCERLPSLVSRMDLLAEVLRAVVGGSPRPDLRHATIFDNEILLHQDPGGVFSLRLYLYGPGERTFVHDHTTWGVSASASGRLEIERFRRAAGTAGTERTELAAEERLILSPGELETTLPFDRGIHRTGNPDAGTTWMLSVYGPPARRAVMHRYDLETGRVETVFPPRVRKRMLAEQALRDLAAPAQLELRTDDSAVLSR